MVQIIGEIMSVQVLFIKKEIKVTDQNYFLRAILLNTLRLREPVLMCSRCSMRKEFNVFKDEVVTVGIFASSLKEIVNGKWEMRSKQIIFLRCEIKYIA